MIFDWTDPEKKILAEIADLAKPAEMSLPELVKELEHRAFMRGVIISKNTERYNVLGARGTALRKELLRRLNKEGK